MLKFYSIAFWDTLYIPHSASTFNLLFIHSSILWNLLLQHQVPSKDHTWGRRSICGPASSLAPARSTLGAPRIPQTRMTRTDRTPAWSLATGCCSSPRCWCPAPRRARRAWCRWNLRSTTTARYDFVSYIVLEGDESTVIINLSLKVVTSIVAMRAGRTTSSLCTF